MVGTWKESQMILALQAIQKNPELSLRSVSKTYGVPYATLRNRRLGLQPKREISANSRRLTDSEDDAIIRYIIELNARSFPPRLSGVEDMANRLLSLRDGRRVGMNWASNFVRRQPNLRTRFNRRIDYQRVLCEDPDAYRAWFTLVRNTITKYGIQEEDIYNFDETGFLMQGNREWVTVIQGVGSSGYVIPLYIIFAGKTYLSSWYENSPLPKDWVIAVTENGWTTNERGEDWIRHFDEHTKSHTKGVYRLLVLDGHESHHSTAFELYCKENSIITLCMPAHSSHKLQPLDVGCFLGCEATYADASGDVFRPTCTVGVEDPKQPN
ncbi:hypothetical protein PG985_005522 [Apiospora marii]|uniref:uncharacterized protein n=1 Tax=Apiospora marii TaxID=335849 RepID=UPI00312DC478